MLVLQGAPFVRVRQRPVQRSVSAAQAHIRALSSPSNPGTVPPSPWLPGGGGGGGGRWPGPGTSEPERRTDESGPVQPEEPGEGGSIEGEPGGEEETGESPEERRSEAGSEGDIEAILREQKLVTKKEILQIL